MQLAHQLSTYVIATVGSLLPIVNPFSAVGLIVGITGHLDAHERLAQIRRACFYMFFILVTFLVAGGLIMSFFGISIPGLRIAGGLIVSFLGFRMLFPESAPAISRAGQAAALQKEDISFTPLAMPLLSGPGSIAVVIGLSSLVEHETGVHRLWGYVLIAVGIALTSFICWLVLRASTRLNALLGPHGITAMTRIMGFLLICIGVQFVINGVLDLTHEQ